MRFLLRPIYRAFFKKPLRWCFTRLRTFFLADLIARLQNIEHLSAQLHDAEANLAAQLHTLRAELIPYLQRAEMRGTDAGLLAQLRAIEANNASQWDGIEQLLLAMFRLPEAPLPASVLDAGVLDETPYLKAIDLNQVHAASNLR